MHVELHGAHRKAARTVRKTALPCKANLRQKIFPNIDPNISYNQEDFIFKPHSNEETHSHAPKTGIETRVLFYRDGKAAALQDKFRAPQEIVDDLLRHREDLTQGQR